MSLNAIPGGSTVTEWERFDKAMKAIMSVPPETAAAIRRGELERPVSRPGQAGEAPKKVRPSHDGGRDQS